MTKTIAEKILARAAGKTSVEPGDSVFSKVDILLTHDVCGPGTIGVLKREFGDDARVWDPERVVIIPDHYIYTTDGRCNRNVDLLRDFAREQGLKYFYDVIDDPDGKWTFDAGRGQFEQQHGSKFGGVCHIALAEHGHVRPGEVLVGTDSHTCTAGAFNQFASGIGNTDAAFVMATGKILLRVPESQRFELVGKLADGVMAKDAILEIIGNIGFDGATYQSMEFGGEGMATLSIDERMTVANMGVEAGAKMAVFEADDQTKAYVDAKCQANGTPCQYETVAPDADAKYLKTHQVDLSTIEPTVAAPHNPANRRKARECGDVKIDRAYIGSCTGGKAADFLAFAEVVCGKQVRVPTYGIPATPQITAYLKKHGPNGNGRSYWDYLVGAGVQMTENAGCAACLGGPADTFGRMNEPEVCISTTNRNFPGRMGHLDGQIFLASPYTVAASAITGTITDPRDVL